MTTHKTIEVPEELLRDLADLARGYSEVAYYRDVRERCYELCEVVEAMLTKPQPTCGE